VTVLCEDQFSTEVFSVSTDANGDIAEQTITYRQWAGTDETLTTYSPHRITLTKAGYETLVLEDVTVSQMINWWHLEMQPALTLPAVGDVWHDTGQYGLAGSLLTPEMVGSDIANLEAGNIVDGIVIDDVTGTYDEAELDISSEFIGVSIQ